MKAEAQKDGGGNNKSTAVLPKKRIKNTGKLSSDKDPVVFDNGMLRITEVINYRVPSIKKLEQARSVAKLVDNIISDGEDDN